MEKNTPFIFIIGFNKTGTRSLHYFFLKNKFPSIHWDAGKLAHKALLNIFNNRKIFEGYDDSFRVFSDVMWINNKIDFQVNKFFKIMDSDYPNSYFIYNFRDEQKWLNSRINHDISNRFPLTKLSLLVNNIQDIEELKNIWLTERRRFEEDVRSYFKDRRNYLELDIEQDDVCSKLEQFLGRKLDSTAWEKRGGTVLPVDRLD
jgi:hypothetical protein